VRERSPPSEYFCAQLERIRAASSRGAVVDLACGRGRHALAASAAGIPVLGIDRNRTFLGELRDAAAKRALGVQLLCADLEKPAEIPLASRRCGAVLVFRYLHRPLAAAIARVLAPGGVLIYETFTARQRELGTGPRNPDFLLEPGELPGLFPELEILDHWEGTSEGAHIARLCARARPPA